MRAQREAGKRQKASGGKEKEKEEEVDVRYNIVEKTGGKRGGEVREQGSRWR
jgi:hypothetical protein